jgi:membrane protease YdiL (CAAX protease family)
VEPSSSEPLQTVLAGPTSPGPARPRVWTVVLAVPLYFVAVLLAAAVLAAIVYLLDASARRGPGAPPDPGRISELVAAPAFLIIGALVQSLVGAGIALVAGALSPEPLPKRLALRRHGLGAASLAVASLGMLLVGSVVSELASALGIPLTGSIAELERVVRALSPAALAPAALVLGVVAPICEELLFRGYLQTRFCTRWGSWTGVLLASALFGVAHLDWLQGASAFAGGVFLGWLTVRTGSIVPAIVAHAANNLAAVALARAWPSEAVSRREHVVLLAVSIAGAAAVLWWLAPRLARAAGARAENDSRDENAAPLGG